VGVEGAGEGGRSFPEISIFEKAFDIEESVGPLKLDIVGNWGVGGVAGAVNEGD